MWEEFEKGDLEKFNLFKSNIFNLSPDITEEMVAETVYVLDCIGKLPNLVPLPYIQYTETVDDSDFNVFEKCIIIGWFYSNMVFDIRIHKDKHVFDFWAKESYSKYIVFNKFLYTTKSFYDKDLINYFSYLKKYQKASLVKDIIE
jgi:hypothetical protein